MTPGYCRRRRRALADQVQAPGEIMQGVESYWNPVGGERSGFCSRISGEPSTGGRARTCCQPRVVGWFILGMPCSWIDVRRYDWLSPENKGRNLGQGGGRVSGNYVLTIFGNSTFFQRPMLLLSICPYLHKGKTIKKKNNRGFVIPVPKLANRTFSLTRGFYCSIPYFCVFSISLGVQPKTS